MEKQKPIPNQEKGAFTDTIEQIELNTPEEATAHFAKVRSRLLNVSQWHTLCGMTASHFQLTDEYGNAVDRRAQKGDHFKIEIPGPGPNAGKGYDWVKIETIESDKTNNTEWVAIKVFPSNNPASDKQEAAHFFNSEATSTFMVKREGKTVSAEVHSRNEKPNTEDTNILDTIRNTFVAIGAMLGFSKIQWTQLVKGLIAKDE